MELSKVLVIPVAVILDFNSALFGLDRMDSNDPTSYLATFDNGFRENEDCISVTFEKQVGEAELNQYMSVIFQISKDDHIQNYFVSFYKKS